MLTYEWTIDRLIVAESENGLSNVVKSVYYTISVSDGSNSTTISGSLALPDVVDQSTFVEFDQLNQDLVKNWVISKFDAAELEGIALEKLQSQSLRLVEKTLA